MTHILSSHPATRTLSSRIPAGVLTAGRFVLLFAEMWIVMLVCLATPGVMALPSLLYTVRSIVVNRPHARGMGLFVGTTQPATPSRETRAARELAH